jgi:hypothetical protein
VLKSIFQSQLSEFNSIDVVVFSFVVELILSVALAVELADEFPTPVPADALEFIVLFVTFLTTGYELDVVLLFTVGGLKGTGVNVCEVYV